MAFTKVVGAGIHTLSNITSHNINSSGIITATKFVGPIEGDITAVDATFTGNVSIAKTLTYEDVKNVDSVGIITARQGIALPIDNKSILLGQHEEMRIRHTGSNSEITDEGTGSLRLGGDQIVMGNATFTGDATFNGNVSIGGTLTYEDVKNVDSVGIVTARSGVDASILHYFLQL